MARKIKIQINGSRVEVIFDVSPLRQALGLPLHDLFDSVIYRGHVHSETVGLMLKTVIIDHPQCYN